MNLEDVERADADASEATKMRWEKLTIDWSPAKAIAKLLIFFASLIFAAVFGFYLYGVIHP